MSQSGCDELPAHLADRLLLGGVPLYQGRAETQTCTERLGDRVPADVPRLGPNRTGSTGRSITHAKVDLRRSRTGLVFRDADQPTEVLAADRSLSSYDVDSAAPQKARAECLTCV